MFPNSVTFLTLCQQQAPTGGGSGGHVIVSTGDAPWELRRRAHVDLIWGRTSRRSAMS